MALTRHIRKAKNNKARAKRALLFRIHGYAPFGTALHSETVSTLCCESGVARNGHQQLVWAIQTWRQPHASY